MRSLIRSAVLLLALLVGAPPAVSTACSCGSPIPVAAHLQDRELIFLGTVTQIAPSDEIYACVMNRVRFNVTSYWKGHPGEVVDVLTERAESCCGVVFESGSTYLVYADEEPGLTLPHTALCLGNKLKIYAAGDLELLGTPLAPVIHGTWGRLKSLYGT